MADITLYLLRHGESTANARQIIASQHLDAALSPDGVRQAGAMASRLALAPISTVYASPLLRARQTAEIVCRDLAVEPLFTEDLMEIGLGRLEGKSYAEPSLKAEYERVLNLWNEGEHHVGFADGETFFHAEERLRRLLGVIEDRDTGHVLLVGHCLLFMVFIRLFCENHGPGLESGQMGRGCLSILKGQDTCFRLVEFNIAPEI
jgi:probable phosphoglycerate mutase